MVSVPPFVRMGLRLLWGIEKNVWAMIACFANTGSTWIMITMKWSVFMGNQRSGRTSDLLAKCGLTTLSKCRTQKANLPECETCSFVTRRASLWKMIDQKPHKKCCRCGEFLPLFRFSPKVIKKPNGKVYETYESMCRMCKSEYWKEKLKAEREKGG